MKREEARDKESVTFPFFTRDITFIFKISSGKDYMCILERQKAWDRKAWESCDPGFSTG